MIDAHVHLWALGANGCVWPPPDLPDIHRDFELDDWAEATAGAIARAVLVQSQEDVADTEWLLAIAETDSRVAGIVGWVDLTAPDAPLRVAALAARDKLVGLRPMVQDRAADWYDDPALDRGLAAMAEAGLAFDALVRPRHLPALDRLAARHPELRIVIDHAGKPDSTDPAGWNRDMAALSGRPNVWCKLSGLLTEMRADRVAPTVERLLSLFGAERLVWGSDWPVLLLVGDYRGWLAQAEALIAAEDRPAVFGGNAARLYRLAAS